MKKFKNFAIGFAITAIGLNTTDVLSQENPETTCDCVSKKPFFIRSVYKQGNQTSVIRYTPNPFRVNAGSMTFIKNARMTTVGYKPIKEEGKKSKDLKEKYTVDHNKPERSKAPDDFTQTAMLLFEAAKKVCKQTKEFKAFNQELHVSDPKKLKAFFGTHAIK